MHGSLEAALKVVFPEENWNFLRMRNPYSQAWRGASSPQLTTLNALKLIF